MMKKKDKKIRQARLRKAQRENRKRNIWRPAAPAEYKSIFCRRLISHCSEGYSFESFASVINVPIEKLEQWVKTHPEFAEAREIALSHLLKYWETQAKEACAKKFSIGVWRFVMNRHLKEPAGTRQENEDKPVIILPEEDGTE